MSNQVAVEPGIYLGMEEQIYHSAAALSNSGIKQLMVSPLNYWHCNLNLECEKPEPSKEMMFGTAVHCRLLEPERFAEIYYCAPAKEDYPDLLETVEDLRGYLEKAQLSVKGKKADLIQRCIDDNEKLHIWDIIKGSEREGIALSKADWKKIQDIAAICDADPIISALLSKGLPEISFFVRDPETGVMLKARMDLVGALATIDVKTFSNSRGKSVDKAIFDAIYYEGYYQQAAFYHKVRELARQAYANGVLKLFIDDDFAEMEWLEGFKKNEAHSFGLVFLESCQPHHTKVIQLKERDAPGADMNIYWIAAQQRIEAMTQLYADCLKKYGDKPWREPAEIHVLNDQDITQLAFG